MRDEQRKLRFKKNETKMKTITFETRSEEGGVQGSQAVLEEKANREQ